MQHRRRDTQIFWVCLFAVVFWVGIWNHEKVGELLRKSPIPKVLRWVESGSTTEK